MKEEVKEFIIDLLEGNNEFDLKELRKTEYDMRELVDGVICEFGEEELCISSLMNMVGEFAKEEFIEKAQEYLKGVEITENNKEDIEKLKEVICKNPEIYWNMYINGLDNHISFLVNDSEIADLIKEYFEDIIEYVNKKIGFTSLNIE